MKNVNYRKNNDGSHNSSTYHKKDGTPMRHFLKVEAEKEIKEALVPLEALKKLRDDLISEYGMSTYKVNFQYVEDTINNQTPL